MKRPKSLAEQIADLDDPAPRDFDPEDDRETPNDGDESISEASREDFDGREHYEQVGKSQLRRPEEPALGPRYVGSRISRKALLQQVNDGDSRAANGASESESTPSEALDSEDLQSGEDEDMEDAYGQDESIEDDTDDEDDFAINGTAGPRKANNIKERARGVVNGRSNTVLRSTCAEHSGNGLNDDYKAFTGVSQDEHSGDSGSEDEDIGTDSVDGEETSDEEDEEHDEDGEDDGIAPGNEELASRAELRKMMSEEQRTVVKTIAEATKADAEKGRALKHQRKAYDALLNTRIRLQKALVAVNSLPVAQAPESNAAEQDSEVYVAAEEVALRLWTQLSDLRQQLHQALPISHSTGKRKRDLDSSAPSLSELAQEMREDESAASPYRQAVLEKWSAKVRGAGTQAAARRLNNSVKQPTITDILTEHLSNQERLLKRTRVPRSCAPLQAQSGVYETAEIYDDADFYQLQLKELIDQRMVDESTTGATSALTGSTSLGPGQNPWTAMREAKTRRKVDTKASKGRKIRYTVHDKLQNFMVPDDRGTWGKRQVDELFGSLLGARMRLEENEEEGEGEGGVMGGDVEEGGLMLFRSR